MDAVRSAAAGVQVKEDRQGGQAGREAGLTLTGKAHTRDHLQALSKLGEVVDGTLPVVSQPPIVVPVRDWEATYGLSAAAVEGAVREPFRGYRAGLREDQRQLLERFELVDVARKVVGVGSVGTRAFIVLLRVATNETRCSCRSRRRPPRSWRARCPRAATASTASGWSPGSG